MQLRGRVDKILACGNCEDLAAREDHGARSEEPPAFSIHGDLEQFEVLVVRR
jgi:hypothetical protein